MVFGCSVLAAANRLSWLPGAAHMQVLQPFRIPARGVALLMPAAAQHLVKLLPNLEFSVGNGTGLARTQKHAGRAWQQLSSFMCG